MGSTRGIVPILNIAAMLAMAGAVGYLASVSARLERALQAVQAPKADRELPQVTFQKPLLPPKTDSPKEPVLGGPELPVRGNPFDLDAGQDFPPDRPEAIAPKVGPQGIDLEKLRPDMEFPADDSNFPLDHFPEASTIVPEEPLPYPDPPPHEGAMVTIPYTVEPPDHIRIELLEALPGRPITGDRLVRPDGTVVLDFYGELEVSGLTPKQIKVKTILHMRKFIPDITLGLLMINPETEEREEIAPAVSDRVFVEVLAYNSKYYYAEGAFFQPGRLPFTGHETVLDAINECRGLAPHADRDHIELVRPARGGMPTRIYPIDYRAIVEKGEASANLQLFPGDRLIAHPIQAQANPEAK
ncbi:MAG: hypothetical protein U0800_18705 [Isosphaeraceae bacterium]